MLKVSFGPFWLVLVSSCPFWVLQVPLEGYFFHFQHFLYCSVHLRTFEKNYIFPYSLIVNIQNACLNKCSMRLEAFFINDPFFFFKTGLDNCVGVTSLKKFQVQLDIQVLESIKYYKSSKLLNFGNMGATCLLYRRIQGAGSNRTQVNSQTVKNGHFVHKKWSICTQKLVN